MITFDHATSACYEDGRCIKLSRLQRRIVGRLMEADGAVTTTTLKAAVWGEDVSDSTVAIAIQRLRFKFDSTIIVTRRSWGYRWVGLMKHTITADEYHQTCDALYGLAAALLNVGIVELRISEKDKEIFWDTKGGGVIDPDALRHFAHAVEALTDKLIEVAA